MTTNEPRGPQDWQAHGGPQPPAGYSPPPGAYQPGPAGYPAPPEVPGRTLGIVGLILSFFTGLIGLVVSIIALRQSRRAGFSNTPAVIGIVVGAITTLVGIIVAIVFVVALAAVASKCQELGPGVHQVGGITYTCS